jgi:ATP-dependent DNA helicase RecG
VEVGVNVPNATVMMVEDAQRFGLAQLHQLRGRVGRGDAQAYCILVNTATDGAASKRLEVMKHSNDGFEIAGMDLKMRGPGDLFGIRQSGLLDFRIGDVYADAGILQSACDMADRIIGEDAALSSEKYRGISEKLQWGAGNEASHIAI